MGGTNTEICLGLKLTFEDYMRFCYFLTMRKIVLCSIAAFFLFKLIIFLQNVDKTPGKNVLPALLNIGNLGGSVTALAVAIALVLIVYRRSGKIYGAQQRMRLEQQYSINAVGMRIRSGEGDMELKWEQVRRAAETRKSFYMLTAANQAVILPKRIFSSSAEIALFKGMASAGMKGREVNAGGETGGPS